MYKRIVMITTLALYMTLAQTQTGGNSVPAVKIKPPTTAQQDDFQKRIDAVKEAKGQPVPEFKMVKLDDKIITHKDLIGKVTVIDFWATWCGPCKAAAPKLDAFHKEFSGKGLWVIGANLAERGPDRQILATKDNAVAYVNEHKYAYTFTYANDDLGKAWKVPGYPTFFIVDRKGIIRNVMVGFNEPEMRKTITDLLAEK